MLDFVRWYFLHLLRRSVQSVQLLRCVQLFATPWTAARQASLSNTNSQSWCWTVEMIIWFLSFILLILVYHINWLVDDEPSLYPWNKPYLIMVCIFIYCCILMYCWIYADISLRNFASCSSEILACNFFPCGVLVCFWYQNTSFTRWVWQSSLLFCFWHFRRTVTYSLNVW